MGKKGKTKIDERNICKAGRGNKVKKEGMRGRRLA